MKINNLSASRTIQVFCHHPRFRHGKKLLAGLLRREPISNHYIFTYDSDFLKAGLGSLDPVNLPLSSRQFHLGSKLSGIFADSAPDWWGRQILSLIHNDANLTEIDYLLSPDPARVGWLDFGNDTGKIPDISILEQYSSLVKHIEDKKTLSPDENILLQLYHGASIGGSRPKINVMFNGAIWLAKLPSIKDPWSNAHVELFSMKMAETCGIPIPEMRIYNDDILLVKRFDRTKSGLRLGYLSAKTILNLGQGESGSYLSFATALNKLHIPASRPHLFKRMVFNAMIRNIDDHPQNHALLFDGKQTVLSPAFDILPIPYALCMEKPATLAMDAGRYGKSTDLENLYSGCEIFGLSRNEAEEIMDNLIDVFNEKWEILLEECCVNKNDVQQLEPIIRHWEKPVNGPGY